MAIRNEDRETYLGYTQEEDLCLYGTNIRADLTKMNKLCKSHPDVFKCVDEMVIDGKVVGKDFEFPKELISIRTPRKKKPKTDKQKESVKKAREKKVKKT